MPDPTTLLDYATQRRDALKTDLAKASKASTAANDAYNTAQKAQEGANALFAASERRAAEIRKLLTVIPMPADGEALLDELRQKIVAMRHQQAAILDAEQTQAETKATADRAAADLARLSATLAAAEAAVVDAKTDGAAVAQWKAAVALPPLTTLKADAGAALTAPIHVAAEARVAAEIPAELLTRARARGGLEAAHSASGPVAAALELLAKAIEKNAGPAGTVAKQEAASDDAEAALRDYAINALDRYIRALGLLATVADTSDSPLTPAQLAAINDPAIVGPGKAAAAKEQDRDEALDKERAARDALDRAIVAAQGADVDADPSTNAGVMTAQAAYDLAKKALTDAEAAYPDEPAPAKVKARDEARAAEQAAQAALDQAIAQAKVAHPAADPLVDAVVVAAKNKHDQAKIALAAAEAAVPPSARAPLDAWEATVPDTAWRRVAALAEADRVLNGLKAIDPTTLGPAADTAEGALVKALLAAAKADRTVRVLDAEVARLLVDDAFLQASAPRRIFAAIRGDR
jgi:hypothetical protein